MQEYEDLLRRESPMFKKYLREKVEMLSANLTYNDLHCLSREYDYKSLEEYLRYFILDYDALVDYDVQKHYDQLEGYIIHFFDHLENETL